MSKMELRFNCGFNRLLFYLHLNMQRLLFIPITLLVLFFFHRKEITTAQCADYFSLYETKRSSTISSTPGERNSYDENVRSLPTQISFFKKRDERTQAGGLALRDDLFFLKPLLRTSLLFKQFPRRIQQRLLLLFPKHFF